MKDIGEPVHAGELLIEIAMPDLQQAVKQQMALMAQRQKEFEVAQKELAVAQSAVESAKVAIRLKEIEVIRAKDNHDARKTELEAVTILYNQNAVVKSRLDAARLDYQAAQRAVEAAEVELEKSKVELAGKTSSIDKVATELNSSRH